MKNEHGGQSPEEVREMVELNSLENSILFDQVGSYVRSLPKVKFNSYEEDCALAKKAQRGNKEAREAMFFSVARLCVREAIKRSQGDEDLTMDLISLGNLAIIGRAIDGYKPELGNKFVTYAGDVIIRSQERGLKKARRSFAIPENVENEVRKIKKESMKYLVANGRQPTQEEIQKLTGLNAAHVKHALSVIDHRVASLSQEIGDDCDETLEEVVDMDTSLYDDFDAADFYSGSEELMDKINTELARLQAIDDRNAKFGNPTRYAETIISRIGLQPDGTLGPGMTAMELARKYGVTRERIKQLQNTSLRRVYDDNLRKVFVRLMLRNKLKPFRKMNI